MFNFFDNLIQTSKGRFILFLGISALIIGGVALYAFDGEYVPNGGVDVETPEIEAVEDDTLPASLIAKIGIGTAEPAGNLHIKSVKGIPGMLLEMPLFRETLFCAPEGVNSDIPSCDTPGCFAGRLNYRYGPPLQWQGGEQKFGKWRQFHNWDERGWLLTYNAQMDFTANWCTPQPGWPGKDVEDVSGALSIDTGEGNSNFVEMLWSGAAPITTPPFHGTNHAPGGAYYNFFQGCSSMTGGCVSVGDGKLYPSLPARIIVSAPQTADAILSLRGGATGVDLKAAGTPIGSWDSTDLFTIEDANVNNILMSFYIPPQWKAEFNSNLSGNVGIGTKTTRPDHKLSVIGTAGLSTGTTWTQISDSRYKDIQFELKGSSLEKIMNLHPVSYQWNSLYQDKYGKKDGLNYGFIAQEVQKVIPEFVTQDNEGYFWYNPSGFEAVLTAAMQERQKQIENLRAEIKELKIRYGF